MKTSNVWWNEVKNDEVKLCSWLKDQYHGEVTAAARIKEIADSVSDARVSITLKTIAQQESTHAEWVKSLLSSRGLSAEVLNKEERYWTKTLPTDYKNKTIEELAAIGAHAERMRLDRIRAIAADETAPSDIRKVFQDILPQEEFHERAFSAIAGDAEMSKALDAHKEGLAALGLIA
jgi:rubrerythrin